MNLQLSDKRVLVTGSTAGIGFAIAKSFALEGANIHINGRSKSSVETAKQRILEAVPGAKVSGIDADLSTIEGFKKTIDAIPQIDILINNLGIFEPVNFFDTNDEDWDKMFQTNVVSGIRLARHYMPSMLERNWGRVIFISSESALQIPTEMIHYGLSKTAQLSLSNGLAQLTKGTGVTVNSILPGPTYSEGVEQFINDLAVKGNTTTSAVEKEFFSETRPLSLLQRFITTDEVAAMVTFISSPLAAATNGAAVRVDGGIIKGLQ